MTARQGDKKARRQGDKEVSQQAPRDWRSFACPLVYLLACLLFCLAVHAEAAAPALPVAEEAKEQLVGAAHRQEYVQSAALAAVTGFDRMIDEIVINRLERDTSLGVHRTVRDGLHETAAMRMSRVYRLLRSALAAAPEGAETARLPLPAAISAAQRDAKQAHTELLNLLKHFGAREQRAAAILRLQKALDEQRALDEQVKQFARNTLGKPRHELPAAENRQVRRMAATQQTLADSTGNLGAFLADVAPLFQPGDEEADAVRRLADEFRRSPVEDDMRATSQSIEANRLAQAAMTGAKTERELARLLAIARGEKADADLDALNAAEQHLQELADVAEEQRDLMGVTATATADDRDAFGLMKTVENNLEQRTRSVAANLREPQLAGILGEDLQRLDSVTGEMAAAADALNAAQKPAALQHEQQALENLEEAIKALRNRLDEARQLAQQQPENDALLAQWKQLQDMLNQLQGDQSRLDEAIAEQGQLITDTRQQPPAQLPALAPREGQIRNDLADAMFAPQNAPFQEMLAAEQMLADTQQQPALAHEEAALVMMQRQRDANAQQIAALEQRLDALMQDMLQEAGMLQQNMQMMDNFMLQQQQLIGQTQQAPLEGLPGLRAPQQELGQQVQPLAPQAAGYMQNAAQHLGAQERPQALQQQQMAIGQMQQARSQMQQRLQALSNLAHQFQESPPSRQRTQRPPQEHGRVPMPGPGNAPERFGRHILPDGWDVNLPPKASQDILRAVSGVFPEEYGAELEAYYRAIAREATR